MTTICDCGHTVTSDGFSTGYGINGKGEKICFSCCGELDKKQLRETGILCGYFTGNPGKGYEFTNWPGSLKLSAYGVKKSWHNFAGRNGRVDFWVDFEGKVYHGIHVSNGSHECATIRLTKKGG